jgi:hypothetical protein
MFRFFRRKKKSTVIKIKPKANSFRFNFELLPPNLQDHIVFLSGPEGLSQLSACSKSLHAKYQFQNLTNVDLKIKIVKLLVGQPHSDFSAIFWMGPDKHPYCLDDCYVKFVINNLTVQPRRGDLHQALLIRNEDISSYLLRRRANVNEVWWSYHETPLHIAAPRGLKKSVEMLLERKANPNAKAISGDTPLHRAAYPWAANSTEDVVGVIKLLIECKANLFAKDNQGLTPMQYAQNSSDFDKSRKTAVIEILEQSTRTFKV